MKLNILIFIIFLVCAKVSFSQTKSYYVASGESVYSVGDVLPDWYQNLQKYWFYRYRLVNDFTYIGPNSGESLIAQQRYRTDNHIDIHTDRHQSLLSYGSDQTDDLGTYLGVLATEYEQLKQNGFNTDRTLYEIKYAQNAYDRLRYYSEYYYSNSPAGGCYPFTLVPLITVDVDQGFFIRDDVPPWTFLDDSYVAYGDIDKLHKNHFNRPALVNSFPYKQVTDVDGSFTGCYWGTNPATGHWLSPPTTGGYPATIPNCESQDQLQSIFLGESLLCKYLDDAGSILQRSKAQNALYHTMKYLEHHEGTPLLFWSIPDPDNECCECAKHDCGLSGIFYTSSLAAMHATHNVLESSGSSWASDANSLAVNTENMLAYGAFALYYKHMPGCCDLATQNVVFTDVYNCFAPEYKNWNNYCFFCPPAIGLVVNMALNYSHWLASSETSKYDDTWATIVHHAEALGFDAPHLPLVFQLNEHDRGWSRNGDIETLLTWAPPCGTYNYENATPVVSANMGQEDWYNATGLAHSNYTNMWSGNSCLTDNEHRQGIDCFSFWGDNCNKSINNMNYASEFNGLDYMFLFNLYGLQRGQASHPYLHGYMNSYYCENFDVNYPDLSHGNIGSFSKKLKLNWLEYLSAKNIINGNLGVSPNPGWLDYRGAKVIDLIPGFWAKNGCFFDAHIKDYDCSGGDLGSGPYNFAEMNPTSILPKHYNSKDTIIKDSVVSEGGFRPVVYLPKGEGYKARPYSRPITLNDNTNNEDNFIGNKDYYLKMYKDTIIKFVNIIKQYPSLQKLINMPEDSLNSVLSYYSDSTIIDLFPNPTNGISYLTYYLSDTKNINITIANALGQNFNFILDDYEQIQEAGNHKITLDAKKLLPGLYYISIIIGDNIITKKWTIL